MTVSQELSNIQLVTMTFGSMEARPGDLANCSYSEVEEQETHCCGIRDEEMETINTGRGQQPWGVTQASSGDTGG